MVDVGLQKVARRRLVLLGGQLSQAGGALQLRHQRRAAVLGRRGFGEIGRRLGFVDVAQHVRPVLQVHAHLCAVVAPQQSKVDDINDQRRALPLGSGLSALIALKRRQTDLDDVETHVDDVPAAGAVVAGARETLEGVGQVAKVQVVVAEVVVAAPDRLLDRVGLILFAFTNKKNDSITQNQV